MDTNADNDHPTPGDIRQSTPVSCLAGHPESDNVAAPHEDAVPNHIRPHPFDMNPSLVTTDKGITITTYGGHEGQGSIHLSKCDRGPSDTLTARDMEDSTTPESSSCQVMRPTALEDHASGCVLVPAERSTSVAELDESGADIIAHTLEPLLLPTGFPKPASGDDIDPEPDEPSNRARASYEDADLVPSDGRDHLMGEEQGQEDLDDICDDIPSSVPPSSSLPQLFSSSPCVSSQSSTGDAEPSEVVLTAKPVNMMSDHDCPHADDVASSDSPARLGSINLHDHDNADIAMSSATATHSPDTLRIDTSSRRQIAADLSDTDELYEPQPTKRQKLDLSYSSPPAPKRATVASQTRQFKKLSAPFRPPSKLPVAMGGPAQARNSAEPNTHSRNDGGQDKSELKEPTTSSFYLQNKVSGAPRSITQFKSPLVNRVLPTDTRAVRLTPAVQALERKLQLLKRAVKVKEDKEEEVLVRLADKWLEAGREVAYDVWDVTKEAGEFDRRGTSVQKSYGWENANDRNVPWGWDTKSEDASKGFSDTGSSDVPFSSERLVPEEGDEDVYHHTLGNMLRQLGIAPEIFGWDDDKEVFE